jgi:hypothetical protein
MAQGAIQFLKDLGIYGAIIAIVTFEVAWIYYKRFTDRS